MRPAGSFLFIAAWLLVTASAYAFILTRDERGTSMAGSMLAALAILGGGACLLNAFAILIAGAFRPHPARFRRFLMWLAAAASFAGIIPVLRLGGALYRQEQEEAKRFVEQRIADAEQRHGAGQPWPTTQDEFIAGQPLPRVLRGKRFYRFEGPDARFEIVIHVDFDGGWFYHSERRTWHRST